MQRLAAAVGWRSPMTEESLLAILRAVSLVLAGIVFVVAGRQMPLVLRLVLVAALGVEAWAVRYGFTWYRTSRYALVSVIVLEALGILFLVAMTGGIESPFIWYALNPAVVAASTLGGAACWLTLAGSLGAAMLAYRFLFHHQGVSWYLIVHQNLSLILLFAMITMAVQLFSNSTRALEARTRELEQQRRELHGLNARLEAESERTKGLLQELMGLYQVVERASSLATPSELMETFATYAQRITQSSMAFFAVGEEEPYDIVFGGEAIPWLEEALSGLPHPLLGLTTVQAEREPLLVVPVRSESWAYGLLGIRTTQGAEEVGSRRDLAFLAELAAVTLERLRLEAEHDDVIVLEEQQRIAEDMHDRIAQRLFSLVYALHGVKRRWPELPGELLLHLATLQDAASETLREVRRVIRHLSQDDVDAPGDLLDDVKTYCRRLEELHQVRVRVAAEGDLSQLPPVVRHGVRRVVAEASANALRHGEAKTIDLEMTLQERELHLEIRDDGHGFTLDASGHREDGEHLGLSNMRALAARLGGTLQIESQPGQGTSVQLMVATALPSDERLEREGSVVGHRAGVPSPSFLDAEQGGRTYEDTDRG